MLDFITAGPNLPFTIALAVMLGLAVLELVTTLLGASLSSLIDQAIPEFDADVDVDVGADMDVDGDVGGAGALETLLGWFYVGKVPFLILLVIWLTTFGMIGLVGQSIAANVTGGFMPGLVAAAVAFLVALPVVRGCAGMFARLVPKETTTAVSEDSFVGRLAIVILGEARPGEPAQAKLTDEHGQDHYVMVEPRGTDTLTAGTTVRLLRRSGAIFTAVSSPARAALPETDEVTHNRAQARAM